MRSLGDRPLPSLSPRYASWPRRRRTFDSSRWTPSPPTCVGTRPDRRLTGAWDRLRWLFGLALLALVIVTVRNASVGRARNAGRSEGNPRTRPSTPRQNGCGRCGDGRSSRTGPEFTAYDEARHQVLHTMRRDIGIDASGRSHPAGARACDSRSRTASSGGGATASSRGRKAGEHRRREINDVGRRSPWRSLLTTRPSENDVAPRARHQLADSDVATDDL